MQGGLGMTTRLRVRDLAKDLGISSKDLLNILRELDIEAKSTTSGLTEDEIDRARKHHQEKMDAPQPVESRAATGVIVRKRRRDVPKKTADDTPTAEAEATPAAEDQSNQDAEPTERPKRTRERKSQGAVIITPARIIAEPTPATEDVAPPEPRVEAEIQPEPQPEAPAEAPIEAEVAEQPQPQAADETAAPSTESETSTEDHKQDRKKGRKAKPAPAPVQVKIISRPKIVEFPDTRAADGTPVRPMGPAARPAPQRPGGPAGRPGGGFQRPADAGRPAPAPAPATDSRGKKKKGRRMV
ncbi:MAG: translation initiation factor IF-2, partial [Deltaproteobacteria bacterium]|nr:translation initiation factor IF-2 [Deltaproteobacteria bacterium]